MFSRVRCFVAKLGNFGNIFVPGIYHTDRLVQAYRPECVKDLMPSPFLWRYTLKLGTHVFCEPLPTRCRFFFNTPDVSVIFVVVGYLGLGRFKISGGKQKKHNSSTVWQRLIEHLYNQDVHLKNGVDIYLDSRAETMCNYRYLLLTLRSQVLEYLRETFYIHASEYLQSTRSKKRKKTVCFCRTETPDHFWPS